MRNVFVALLLFTIGTASGSDSLQVSLSGSKLVKGDTLEFTCTIPNYEAWQLQNATLNVWIEDVAKTHRWKFRYPIIKGEVTASIVVSDKIPDGAYAVNFLVQQGFFKISGQVLDHNKKDTQLLYMMIPKNRTGSHMDYAKINTDGSFRLRSTLFADSAFYVFTPAKKTNTNNLNIKIRTELDSAFVSVLNHTSFIHIGDPKMLLSKFTDTTKYLFDADLLTGPEYLPNVTVTAKSKKKIEQYEEEYVSSSFQDFNARVFNGLDDNNIGRSVNIFQYLSSRVLGLSYSTNSEGMETVTRYNNPVDVYIDEFKMDPAEFALIIPSEVAMIKVFDPPKRLPGGSSSGNNGGAIALYTKKGVYTDRNMNIRHNFIVTGYTSIESVWQ